MSKTDGILKHVPIERLPKIRGLLNHYQPKQCTIVREIPKITIHFYICIKFDPPKYLGNLMTPGIRTPRISLWGFNVTPRHPTLLLPSPGLDFGWLATHGDESHGIESVNQKSPNKQIQGYTRFMDAMWEKAWKIV